MAKKRESKVKVGVTCQCQDPAVPRPPKLLRKTQCKDCGKIFQTNRPLNEKGVDRCLKCRTKR